MLTQTGSEAAARGTAGVRGWRRVLGVLEREHQMVLPIMPGRVQGLVYSRNPSTKKAEAGGSLVVEAWSHGNFHEFP